MAAEFSDLADRAEYYRHLAAVVRLRAASVKTRAACDALATVARDYELLAHCAESLRRTELTLQQLTLQQQPIEQHQRN